MANLMTESAAFREVRGDWRRPDGQGQNYPKTRGQVKWQTLGKRF
jgi:hypothetical protein